MIECRVEGTGVLVPVRAQPGASRAAIGGEHMGSLKIAVTEPPERGRANAAIAKALAKALGVRPAAVQLVSAGRSRNKVFRIEGVTAERVRRLA